MINNTMVDIRVSENYDLSNMTTSDESARRTRIGVSTSVVTPSHEQTPAILVSRNISRNTENILTVTPRIVATNNFITPNIPPMMNDPVNNDENCDKENNDNEEYINKDKDDENEEDKVDDTSDTSESLCSIEHKKKTSNCMSFQKYGKEYIGATNTNFWKKYGVDGCSICSKVYIYEEFDRLSFVRCCDGCNFSCSKECYSKAIMSNNNNQRSRDSRS